MVNLYELVFQLQSDVLEEVDCPMVSYIGEQNEMRNGTMACRLPDGKIGTCEPGSFVALVSHDVALQRAIRNGRCRSGVICTVSNSDISEYTVAIAAIFHAEPPGSKTVCALVYSNHIFDAGPNPRCAVDTLERAEHQVRQKEKSEDCHKKDNL